ncbi:hypothetical protein KFL_003150090 [Klebsormidium nitens]|uniref:Uncharacterized protein n=1 Tax=Klebsormidium nitens TaxID=105231 RepID=A0A1Y1I7A7_KLENI|nr:hypothetical protein KFL_003150090 [Klebsormidium nitens]|eukprot:GAQ86844.1 hypothetical protein KFL_003150090 [Klebsormidium nitens]
MVTWWPAGTWQRRQVSGGAAPEEKADPVTSDVQAVTSEAEEGAEEHEDYQLTLKEAIRKAMTSEDVSNRLKVEVWCGSSDEGYISDPPASPSSSWDALSDVDPLELSPEGELRPTKFPPGADSVPVPPPLTFSAIDTKPANDTEEEAIVTPVSVLLVAAGDGELDTNPEGETEEAACEQLVVSTEGSLPGEVTLVEGDVISGAENNDLAEGKGEMPETEELEVQTKEAGNPSGRMLESTNGDAQGLVPVAAVPLPEEESATVGVIPQDLESFKEFLKRYYIMRLSREQASATKRETQSGMDSAETEAEPELVDEPTGTSGATAVATECEGAVGGLAPIGMDSAEAETEAHGLERKVKVEPVQSFPVVVEQTGWGPLPVGAYPVESSQLTGAEEIETGADEGTRSEEAKDEDLPPNGSGLGEEVKVARLGLEEEVEPTGWVSGNEMQPTGWSPIPDAMAGGNLEVAVWEGGEEGEAENESGEETENESGGGELQPTGWGPIPDAMAGWNLEVAGWEEGEGENESGDESENESGKETEDESEEEENESGEESGDESEEEENESGEDSENESEEESEAESEELLDYEEENETKSEQEYRIRYESKVANEKESEEESEAASEELLDYEDQEEEEGNVNESEAESEAESENESEAESEEGSGENEDEESEVGTEAEGPETDPDMPDLIYDTWDDQEREGGTEAEAEAEAAAEPESDKVCDDVPDLVYDTSDDLESEDEEEEDSAEVSAGQKRRIALQDRHIAFLSDRLRAARHKISQLEEAEKKARDERDTLEVLLKTAYERQDELSDQVAILNDALTRAEQHFDKVARHRHDDVSYVQAPSFQKEEKTRDDVSQDWASAWDGGRWWRESGILDGKSDVIQSFCGFVADALDPPANPQTSPVFSPRGPAPLHRSPFKTSWAQELESELSHAVVGFADLFFDGEPSPVWQHIGDVLPVALEEIRHELVCTAEEITPGKLARGVSGIVKDAFEGFRREWDKTGGQW